MRTYSSAIVLRDMVIDIMGTYSSVTVVHVKVNDKIKPFGFQEELHVLWWLTSSVIVVHVIVHDKKNLLDFSKSCTCYGVLQDEDLQVNNSRTCYDAWQDKTFWISVRVARVMVIYKMRTYKSIIVVRIIVIDKMKSYKSSKGAKIRNRYNHPEYQWESDKFTVRHHKQEPRGQPFPSQ